MGNVSSYNNRRSGHHDPMSVKKNHIEFVPGITGCGVGTFIGEHDHDGDNCSSSGNASPLPGHLNLNGLTRAGSEPLTTSTPFSRNRKDMMSMRIVPKVEVPMPSSEELERRFLKVLASMDLPPDKAKLLKQYDDPRKWEIICDKERVQAPPPPSSYLRKLQTYLDPKASRSFKKRKVVGDSTSTQVLKDLEISLRTNNIEWVREFLNQENRGLEVLVDYLSFRLVMMRHEEQGEVNGHEMGDGGNSLRNGAISMMSNGSKDGTLGSSSGKGSPMLTMNKRQSRHMSKLNMGDTKDDIHVCILCLRAIMNNKHGLNMVIQKQESINAIALSVRHKGLRTKALVLELLAAVCLVQGGHEIILKAFDNFKDVCGEKRRFETLVNHFMYYEFFHVEFMVACMQFINIVVHSVDDMNQRVYLHYEFQQLGIDQYLEKLKNTPSEELRVQISAYLDNIFDVAALMEDSETKSAALERVSELEEEVSQLKEIYEKLEADSLARMVELETKLNEVAEEREMFASKVAEMENELEAVIGALKAKEEERQRILEELERRGTIGGSLTGSMTGESPRSKVGDEVTDSTKKPPVPVAPPAPAPPPPPPPPPGMGPPPPPPPPLMSGGPGGPPPPPMIPPGHGLTIKRAPQPKCKLPTLNWTVLKPQEVKGTVFNQLNDSKYYNLIDFDNFERLFQIGNSGGRGNLQSDQHDGDSTLRASKIKKAKEAVSLLEHTRLRNLAISRRKLDMPIEAVVKAINALDLKVLKFEQVEVLQRMVPTEQEAKLYREYIAMKKNPDLLTDEDKFLLQLSKIERISVKLNVMAYIANFTEQANVIQPQVHSVIMCSRSVRASEKFHQLLEIILAFGNYMNGAKRGPAYGFKIQSLECLTDTKSVDKRQCLMHYIVETIATKFPHLQGFLNDLQFVEKASQVSLENVRADLHDLEKGMELTKKESEFLKQKNEPNPVMREFLATSEDRLNKIKAECKTAVLEFGDCVEFYGEEKQQTDTSGFFSAILKFLRAYKQAEMENEQKKLLSLKTQSPPEIVKVGKKQQDDVINELKKRQVTDNNKKVQELYHGALEAILSDLKNEPYRRADALRRSQRRRHDASRLSRNFDDLEV